MDTKMRNLNMTQGGWTAEDMIASQMGRMRPFPELAFYIDDSMDYVERIDKLLKK
jgi:ribosome-binding factor A